MTDSFATPQSEKNTLDDLVGLIDASFDNGDRSWDWAHLHVNDWTALKEKILALRSAGATGGPMRLPRLGITHPDFDSEQDIYNSGWNACVDRWFSPHAKPSHPCPDGQPCQNTTDCEGNGKCMRSGGSNPQAGDAPTELIQRLRNCATLLGYDLAPGLYDAAMEAADALTEQHYAQAEHDTMGCPMAKTGIYAEKDRVSTIATDEPVAWVDRRAPESLASGELPFVHAYAKQPYSASIPLYTRSATAGGWEKVEYGASSGAWPGDPIYFLDADRQRWRYNLPALPTAPDSRQA